MTTPDQPAGQPVFALHVEADGEVIPGPDEDEEG